MQTIDIYASFSDAAHNQFQKWKLWEKNAQNHHEYTAGKRTQIEYGKETIRVFAHVNVVINSAYNSDA